MHHPFNIGQSYSREEILPFLGSNQRFSGIVYGAVEPGMVAVFTGSRHGTRAGYLDHWNDDGSFSYCGQGTKGDQRLTGAPTRYWSTQFARSCSLRRGDPGDTWKGRNRFLGEHLVAGYHWEARSRG